MAAKKKTAKKRGKTAARRMDRGSRARAEAKAAKADRVARCLDLMASGLWRTGITGTEVAKEFGVSPRTLEADAAEASRMLRSRFSDEELEIKKAQLLATLETATAIAAGQRSARDLRECATAELEALGLMPSKKLEHDVGGSLAEILALAGAEGGG